MTMPSTSVNLRYYGLREQCAIFSSGPPVVDSNPLHPSCVLHCHLEKRIKQKLKIQCTQRKKQANKQRPLTPLSFISSAEFTNLTSSAAFVTSTKKLCISFHSRHPFLLSDQVPLVVYDDKQYINRFSKPSSPRRHPNTHAQLGCAR